MPGIPIWSVKIAQISRNNQMANQMRLTTKWAIWWNTIAASKAHVEKGIEWL